MKINLAKKDLNIQITSSSQDYINNTTDLALNILDKLMNYNPDSPYELDSTPVQCLDLSNLEPRKFETEQVFSPDKEDKPEVQPKKEETVTKRLTFLRCPHCGNTFCIMLPFDCTEEDLKCLADSVICATCSTDIPTGYMRYYRGTYTCECGAKGFFVMPDDVDIVKCKDCDHKFYMMFDPENKRYNGTPLPKEEVL